MHTVVFIYLFIWEAGEGVGVAEKGAVFVEMFHCCMLRQLIPCRIRFVYNKTGLHSVGHNRYWSNDTTYARRNGGRYNFIVEAGSFAVPDDQVSPTLSY